MNLKGYSTKELQDISRDKISKFIDILPRGPIYLREALEILEERITRLESRDIKAPPTETSNNDVTWNDQYKLFPIPTNMEEGPATVE